MHSQTCCQYPALSTVAERDQKVIHGLWVTACKRGGISKLGKQRQDFTGLFLLFENKVHLLGTEAWILPSPKHSPQLLDHHSYLLALLSWRTCIFAGWFSFSKARWDYVPSLAFNHFLKTLFCITESFQTLKKKLSALFSSFKEHGETTFRSL